MPKEKPEVETFQVDVEFTDTFGGNANYSWVRRETLTLPVDISDRELMRRAKAAMGLTGVRGTVCNHGDMIDFRPFRSCTVMFVTTVY